MSPAGVFEIVHQLQLYFEGSNPLGGVILASDGNLYGTASYWGANNAGTLFRCTPTGQFTVLHNFGADPSDGINPQSALIQASNGMLYGTANLPGTSGGLVIFELGASGYRILSTLTGINGGQAQPLVEASDGNLWGSASGYGDATVYCGVVFAVSKTGSLVYQTPLPSIAGCQIRGALVQGINGALYGTTAGGLENAAGSIIEVNAGLAAPKPAGVGFTLQGSVGSTIYIHGFNLDGTRSVSFNGASTQFKVLSPNFIAATVPAGATSGPITVTNFGGSTTSEEVFTVTP